MMNSAILLALALTAPATSVDGAVSVSAPDASHDDGNEVAAIVAARSDAERDHLRRLGLWGASSVVGGAALYFLSELSAGVTGEIHYIDAGFNITGMPGAPEIKALFAGDQGE